jgi:hypothetical protein
MNRKWKCGRKLPGRLAVVVKITRKPINRLVYNYRNDCSNYTPVYQNHFTEVIQGKKNLTRYIEILEREWRLPISEIREIYSQDKQNPPDIRTLVDFEKSFLAKLQGKTVDELYSKERALGALNLLGGMA